MANKMAKKTYEKPELEGKALFEASTIAGCCQVSKATCGVTLQGDSLKDARVDITS